MPLMRVWVMILINLCLDQALKSLLLGSQWSGFCVDLYVTFVWRDPSPAGCGTSCSPFHWCILFTYPDSQSIEKIPPTSTPADIRVLSPIWLPATRGVCASPLTPHLAHLTHL